MSLKKLEIDVWMENWDKLRENGKKTRVDFETVLNQTKSEQVELDRLYTEAERFAEKMHEKDRLPRTRAERWRRLKARFKRAGGQGSRPEIILSRTMRKIRSGYPKRA
jgi:hypothetical protein